MPALIRFADTKYNLEFLKEGKIWMNKLAKHKANEVCKVRGDALEGISKLLRPKWFELIIEDQETKEKKVLASTHPKIRDLMQVNEIMLTEFDQNHNGNIFCMTAIDDEWLDSNDSFDQKMNEFCKKSASMVYFKDENIGVFINRVQAEVEKHGFKMYAGRVKYYDTSVDQLSLGPFDKRNDLIYQSEFRIFIPRNLDNELVLNIGSVEDIADLHVFKENDVRNFKILKHSE